MPPIPSSVADKSLAECLDLVRRVFDADQIASRRIDADGVAEYYRQSDRGYRLFHSAEGALHLALSDGGEFEFDGYTGQAGLVAAQLDSHSPHHVLEAGCGNGFNCIRLARQFGSSRFHGVDLTESHIATARKRAGKLGNVTFQVGNYEQLPHDAETFDLAFAVESLCQTDHLQQAFVELARVLRPGGRLLVIDCFRNRPLAAFPADLQLAARLVEKTTAVDSFSTIDGFVELARTCGFEQHQRVDLSPRVTHNLARLYGLARRFFNMGPGLWAMKKTFGPLMLENAICGLLMPHTVGGGVHAYYSVTLVKGSPDRPHDRHSAENK